MKGLALALWFAAIALLGCILHINDDAMLLAHSRAHPERSLLAIALAKAPLRLQQAPVVIVSAAEEVVPVAGCSRLGIFPRRDWAEHVALILVDAGSRAPVGESAAMPESRMIEEAPVSPWRVSQMGPDAYYLRFDAWGIDELAARMTMQRARLKRLLSINAIPEAC